MLFEKVSHLFKEYQQTVKLALKLFCKVIHISFFNTKSVIFLQIQKF